MKTRIMFLFLATLISVGQLVAQTPQAFKYQAAIRDADGQMLMEQLISLKISILKGDTLGEAVYTEIHDVFTDNMGMVNLCIGEGLPITGNLSDIQWGEDKYFTQVEMDMEGGMNYQLLGTSQLMAVPYALYAESAGNIQWKETENGIYYQNGRVGIGTNSPVATLDIHGQASFSSNTTFGSGNYIGLYLNGADFDDQPEWLINGHSTGKFQIRHYNGSDWEDHYLKIKPNDGFYFGASGPKLRYNFNGWASVSDSLKIGKTFSVGNHLKVTEEGKVGIGTTDPGSYKLLVETTADGGNERAVMHVRNNSTSVGSLCNLYISAGESGSTYLNYTAPSYIHWGGKYKSHSVLGNNGKGLVFRSGQNDEGRFAFEFRREMGSTYTYDEKVSITYEGNLGIGTTFPQRKLHINDVMRLEPRYSPPENPSEGDIYMDGNNHVLKVYDGTEWKSCW